MTTPATTQRLRYAAQLRPALGSAFQPTGFPDIGAAKFERFTPDGSVQDMLLVESVQSMANRLEATTWDRAAHQPAALFADLAYVRVHREARPGEYLTSSREEAHRAASAFVRDSLLDGTSMLQVIAARLGLAKDTPLDYPRMAAELVRLDPFCLVHGVFFNQKEWFGQPRFPRAVSAVIEAYDVRQAVSGGRKSDHVRHQLDKNGTGGGTSEGYGSVPFHRIEWTAREIRAMFSVDVELLRSYALGDQVTELLTLIALWEIRSLLSKGLRLRTACDLEVAEDPAELPGLGELTGRIQALITASRDTLGDGPITALWKGRQ
jgi:CRISPR-associated protein Csb1